MSVAIVGESGTLDGKVQDAHMEDAGEKGRPPGEPPDKTGSLCLEFPDGEDGEPVITIGDKWAVEEVHDC
ncbi:unnamed protein product [Microthlaspi erraticum]|uniref:Uncharacterized protein n=1 Tax=Microthlaspi erraticum TaxID=1685480 RepID=A0A6D2JBA0_9BRAS|nr:unnamed protein product [Microthlaspi erraticum]